MKHGSLFSGIGGFDLAASWMGWENVFQVEIDPFCQKVLEKNFPNTKRYGDIKEFDGTKYRGAIDVLTGGFPCQPFSASGQRKGTEDDRYLWPEMLRIIGEVQPAFIVGENVFGLVNWSDGLVLEQVQTDLEAAGYEVGAFIIPACSVEAPHKRERIWFVAHRNDKHLAVPVQQRRQDSTHNANSGGYGKDGITTHTSSNGLQRRSSGHNEPRTERPDEQPSGLHFIPRQDWQDFPTQPPICGGNDGIPNRVDRIKGLGNAIVPQVAFEIFKAIESCCDCGKELN